MGIKNTRILSSFQICLSGFIQMLIKIGAFFIPLQRI
jgi:hypothetical protein